MLARPGEGRASSPLLWSQERLDELLQGSPVRDMVVERKQALIAEWADISKLISEHDPAAFPPGGPWSGVRKGFVAMMVATASLGPPCMWVWAGSCSA